MLKKHRDLASIPYLPHHHLTKMVSPHQVSLAVKGWTRAWMGRKLKPLPIVPAAAVDEARWWKKEEEEEDEENGGLSHMWGQEARPSSSARHRELIVPVKNALDSGPVPAFICFLPIVPLHT